MNLHKITPRPQRALLPAPPNSVRVPEIRPPKRTNACGECRARKSKCNGARPTCQACLLRTTACEYLPTESRQEKQRAQVADELILLMKSSSDADAIEILRRIRAGADPEAVVRQVRDGNLLMQLSLGPETRRRYELPYISEMPAFLLTPDNPYVPPAILDAKLDSQNPVSSPCYTKPYHAAMVLDPAIDKVTVSKWTSIVSDENLLKQLLRSFFQFAYAEWFPFHKDLFLSDMAANRTRFCSSLLVNAVLANACYSSSNLLDRAKFWLPDNLTYKFTAETKRLWDLEMASGKKKLTTVQASQILSVIMDFDGINSLGRMYTAHGLNMAYDLNLFQSSQNVRNEEMRKARIWTAWSLFAWHSMISYYFHERPIITEPPEDALPDDPEWYGEMHLQYPPSTMKLPIHLCYAVRAKCHLRSIKHSIALNAFDGAKAESNAWLTYGQAGVFVSRLEEWFQALPKDLQPARIVFPRDIGLHIEYLSVITDLLSAHVFKNVGLEELRKPSSNALSLETPAVTVLNANRRKETLLRTYYLRHSFDNFDPMLVNFIIERLGASISSLNADNSTAFNQRLPAQEILRSTLILCATGLRSQAKSYHVCTLAYYALQSQMRAEDLQLLLTYVKPPVETDMPPLNPEAVTSWPLPIISMSDDPKKSALNKMVKDYEEWRSGRSGELPQSQTCSYA